MADVEGSSSVPSQNEKPVIVRVKRKASHSPLEAFWLEINERPLKRPLLDFDKLSISDSSVKVEEFRAKKVFVQHVETVSSSKVNLDSLQSYVHNVASGTESKATFEGRKRSFKTDNKQDQLLAKAKEQQEVLSKNARFEQIWRSRRGKKEMVHDEAIHDVCRFYDVVRVDIEEPSPANQAREQDFNGSDADYMDHMMMSSYLPLLREFIPSAASEIETDIRDYMSKHATRDEYVYDIYTAKDDNSITEQDSPTNPFPLVQVEEDDYYDGPSDTDFETDDSNDENHPLNDYPEEESSEEVESSSSNDESEVESDSDESENLEKCPNNRDVSPMVEAYGGDDCNYDVESFDYNDEYDDDGDGEEYY